MVEEFVINLFLESGEELADERDHNTDGGDNKGEVDGVAGGEHGDASGRDDKGSASGFSERSEKIGSHSSDISNIITNVISDSSRVSGRVFLKSVGDFTGKISTDISSLGVDTTTDSSEESDGRASKTISGNVFEKDSDLGHDEFTVFLSLLGVLFNDNGGFVAEDEDLEDDEGKSDEHESEDLSSSESGIESSEFVLDGTEVGGSNIAVSGDLHSDESADHGGDSSNEECEGGEREPVDLSGFVGHPGHVDGTDENNSEDGAENGEVSVFFDEESVGTILNGLVDFHHSFEAVLVGPGHPGQLFLLIIAFVDDIDVVGIIGLDFVDLNDLNNTPDESEDTTSEDDVMSIGALNSGCSR